MRRFILKHLEARSPKLFNRLRSVSIRRYFRQKFAAFHAEIKRDLYPHNAPITVQSGPFRGLKYFNDVVWGTITPKWLGSYECELHPAISQIIARAYSTIIDVGCAEGYYAVGLAVACPRSTIIAFDTDHISRKQIRRLASLNEVVKRVSIRSYCDFADLDTLSTGNTLLICDIEGFEAHLLDPQRAPRLLRNDILVEVHENELGGPPDTERLLLTRFTPSHHIERIVAVDRAAWVDQHVSEFSLPPDTLARAANEHRDNGRVWFWMQAKTRQN